jgi:hypothetical protein
MRSSRVPKTIAFVGDLHVGSYTGIPAPWWLPRDEHRCSAARYMLRCWRQLLRQWPRQIDALFLMGDLIDGKQPKSACTGVFSASFEEQVDGAIEVLAPLVRRARVVYRVWGTPYHEGFEGALGKLDAAFGIPRSRVAQDHEVLINGNVLNVAHHPSGGACIYKGTALDKEAVWSAVAAAEGKVNSPRWIVRAHQHCYAEQHGECRSVISCPCFQLPTPHALKQNYWRWRPSLGGLLMLRHPASAGGYVFAYTRFPVPLREPVQIGD